MARLIPRISASEAFEKMNEWGAKRIPHLFLFDFELSKAIVLSIDELENSGLEYRFNSKIAESQTIKFSLRPKPIEFSIFKKSFDYVLERLNYGDSFLVNLSLKTPIEIDVNLQDIFKYSRAQYNLFLADEFVCFSPETFVKIEDNQIFSYPIKGTLDADLSNAKQVLLNNKKEKAEHYTIVDLIRNDLSQVASEVSVSKFRTVETIQSNYKNLLQVSSEIQGKLPVNWNENLGTIFKKLLPAGSISGAPKPKTLEIIQNAERDTRGFYTGICGIFDGRSVDSFVMIRFIEKVGKQYFYRSGGGITHKSNAQEEYQEILDKIYAPIY